MKLIGKTIFVFAMLYALSLTRLPEPSVWEWRAVAGALGVAYACVVLIGGGPDNLREWWQGRGEERYIKISLPQAWLLRKFAYMVFLSGQVSEHQAEIARKVSEELGEKIKEVENNG